LRKARWVLAVQAGFVTAEEGTSGRGGKIDEGSRDARIGGAGAIGVPQNGIVHQLFSTTQPRRIRQWHAAISSTIPNSTSSSGWKRRTNWSTSLWNIASSSQSRTTHLANIPWRTAL